MAGLFETEVGQPITESLAGIKDHFGAQTELVVGKNVLGIASDTGNERYSIQELFVPMPEKNGSTVVIKEETTTDEGNLRRLAAIRSAEETVQGEEIARLFGMKLGQQLVNSKAIKARFGETARLALGKNAIGVISDAGNDRYGIQEIFVPSKNGAANEKVTLKPGDHIRIAANTKRTHDAIKQKKNLIVLYRGPNGVRRYILAPLDIAPGKTEGTRKNQYLWLYSNRHKAVLSMRMDKVLWTKVGDEAFDPNEVTQTILKDKKPTWILPREW
ncbi:MAG: hypothetical protein DPW09_39630 [Anaerolineae bacterium]|nr:hypothetical protein [Anaerolineae bacterium]